MHKKKRYHRKRRRVRQNVQRILFVILFILSLVVGIWIYRQQSSNTQDVTILVNYENPVPEDYTVDLVTLSDGTNVAQSIYPSLQQMFDDLRAEGYDPIVYSGYRSYQDQMSIFLDRVEGYIQEGYDETTAYDKALEYVSEPGFSEHQTGLCVDIRSRTTDITQDYEIYEWLIQNCSEYGFILRYPNGKEDITHIQYEPWHYRYVGKEIAEEITTLGITLEEYITNQTK